MSLEEQQKEWKDLYGTILPKAALERNLSQKKWPVTLDHCFARIILDNAVGVDQPWHNVIKQPAIRNMTPEQLLAAINLAKEILDGKVDLVELDKSSLRMRNKLQKYKNEKGALKRGKKALQDGKEDLEELIATCGRTPYQRLVYRLILQIPAGRVSTYGAVANALNSSARAVGNAMRNNPLAPRVPCHRVVASDMSIGGFGGKWGTMGAYANEKIVLLKSEGVQFDAKDKVLGAPFTKFQI